MLKHITAVTLGIIALCSVCLFASCHRDKEQAAKNVAPEVKQPLPGSPDEVVFSSENLKLTMSDYNRCLDVYRIKGIVLSKRAMANPRFQRDEVQRCTQYKFIREFLQKNQVAIDPDYYQSSLDQLLKDAEATDIQMLAQKKELDPEYISQLVESTVLVQTLQKYLVSQIDEAAARMEYNIDQRVLDIEVAMFDNTPTDDEVRTFWSEQSSLISEYLGLHQELRSGRARAKFVRLAYAVNGDPQESSVMQNAEELRLTAIQRGLDAALDKCKADAEQGCLILNDKDNPFIEERNEENAWAFRMPMGSVSDVIQTPVNREIRVTVDTILPPENYDLNDPEIQVMVGRKIMKDMIPVQHVIQPLKAELENPEAVFSEVVEKHGGKFSMMNVTYENLNQYDVLKSQQMVSLLRDVKTDELNLYSNPVVDNGSLYIVRVTGITPVTDDDFKNGEAAWRKRKSDDPEHKLANEWLMNNMPHMFTFNIEPIKTHYGTLQPNGTIK